MTTKKKKKEQLTDGIVLHAKDIQFGYNRRQIILHSVSLEVKRGEIVGISGENGSGKTTLLKILIGLLKPRTGSVTYSGRINYSPQNLLLFENLTVLENFMVFGKGMGLTKQEIEQSAQEIMERLNFSQYQSTLVKKLSGGTAQKANFGLSLLGNPEILVLDEPYQGMDYTSFLAFWEIQHELRKEGKAIIIVSHLIENQSNFTRSLHLVNGRLQCCKEENCPLCQGECPEC